MQYKYGKRKELQVREFLENRRFKCERSQGSKGPADLFARKGKTKLLIQVKATRKDQTSYTKLSIKEEKALESEAKHFKAIPVLALVSKNYVWFVSVPDDELLEEGELKPLKYVYPGER